MADLVNISAELSKVIGATVDLDDKQIEQIRKIVHKKKETSTWNAFVAIKGGVTNASKEIDEYKNMSDDKKKLLIEEAERTPKKGKATKGTSKVCTGTNSKGKDCGSFVSTKEGSDGVHCFHHQPKKAAVTA